MSSSYSLTCKEILNEPQETSCNDSSICLTEMQQLYFSDIIWKFAKYSWNNKGNKETTKLLLNNGKFFKCFNIRVSKYTILTFMKYVIMVIYIYI